MGREAGTAAGQQPWTKHQHLPAWWRAARLERGRESNTFVPNSGSWRVGEGDVLDLHAPARTGYLDVDVHLGYGSFVTTGSASGMAAESGHTSLWPWEMAKLDGCISLGAQIPFRHSSLSAELACGRPGWTDAGFCGTAGSRNARNSSSGLWGGHGQVLPGCSCNPKACLLLCSAGSP